MPTIAVGLSVSDARALQLHAGVIYAAPGQPARVLHLAWHGITKSDPLPHRLPFWWVTLRAKVSEAETLNALCRKIARRVDPKSASPMRIPYGLLYEGHGFTPDGVYPFEGQRIGLTCATFVLAVFASAGLHLLDLASWQRRHDDDDWHTRIVESLERYREQLVRDSSPELAYLPTSHIDGVRGETSCSRYRPEEVAAACSLPTASASFLAVRTPADEILATLLPG